MLRGCFVEPRSRGFPRGGYQTSRCTAGSVANLRLKSVSTGLAFWLEPLPNHRELAQATCEKAVETASMNLHGFVPAVQRLAYQP
jgi:hypothetical protein